MLEMEVLFVGINYLFVFRVSLRAGSKHRPGFWQNGRNRHCSKHTLSNGGSFSHRAATCRCHFANWKVGYR